MCNPVKTTLSFIGVWLIWSILFFFAPPLDPLAKYSIEGDLIFKKSLFGTKTVRLSELSEVRNSRLNRGSFQAWCVVDAENKVVFRILDSSGTLEFLKKINDKYPWNKSFVLEKKLTEALSNHDSRFDDVDAENSATPRQKKFESSLNKGFPNVLGWIATGFVLLSFMMKGCSSAMTQMNGWWLAAAFAPLVLCAGVMLLIGEKRHYWVKGRDFVTVLVVLPIFLLMYAIGIGGFLNEYFDSSAGQIRSCTFHSADKSRKICSGITVKFTDCPSACLDGNIEDYEFPRGSKVQTVIQDGFFGFPWISEIQR